MFGKTTTPQKNCLLVIDEVKIKPTVAYTGGFLSGYAKNDPKVKATSILAVMLKCLHGGPTTMVSITPVHKLTASYQYSVVKDAAKLVEMSGGYVIGSVTDNHKVNQKYCDLFNRKSAAVAVHPLDDHREWFLLFDTVHLLKCIRNNLISEKNKMMTFDNDTIGVFKEVQDLYKCERENILKTTPLTMSAVYPTPLQRQNVKHVTNVFNDKVVTALELKQKHGTANFIKQVLQWWKIVNVKGQGEVERFNDPCICFLGVALVLVQTELELSHMTLKKLYLRLWRA